MLVTLLDAQRDIDNQKARYQQVAGRVSILREALHRANAEIRRIYEAVEAEEDGAEVLLTCLSGCLSYRREVGSVGGHLSARRVGCLMPGRLSQLSKLSDGCGELRDGGQKC